MRCVICKDGETHHGYTTVTLGKEDTTLIVKQVPAEICDTCGEYYLDQETTGRVMKLSKEAREEGVEVKIMKYPHETDLVAAS